ncbi:hypothetical protein [Pseudomonas mangrovi]|uniref:hypothetical protein n=1 Tax=Pseudomonas mangrovi TaxID=2161748 RepID=UPI0011B2051D|nr:hypothetical protein [Pseudomonas mangrovi]
MEVEAIGPKHTNERHESDIYSVSDSKEGLTILIDTKDESGNRRDLRVYFEYARGFRYLDEGDLIHYWESKAFSTPHHVFKILSGGWSNGEAVEPGILSVSKAVEITEWFVATTNNCINVLTESQPLIEFIDA